MNQFIDNDIDNMDNARDLINICDICENITNDDFLKKIIDVYDEFSDEKEMYKFLSRCLYRFRDKINSQNVYKKFKILLDYSCKNFNLKYEDLCFSNLKLLKNKVNLGYAPKLKFSIDYYFKGYDYAIEKIKPSDYYYIHDIWIIDEAAHKSILKKLKYVKPYFEDCILENNYDEIDKCLKYGYRPSTKTWNEMLAFENNEDIKKLLEILKKYNISHEKIIESITNYLILTLDIECLDFCLNNGINISFDTEQMLVDSEINFIQKLINLGLSTIEIINVMIKRRR